MSVLRPPSCRAVLARQRGGGIARAGQLGHPRARQRRESAELGQRERGSQGRERAGHRVRGVQRQEQRQALRAVHLRR